MVFLICTSESAKGQEAKGEFWDNVRFGGGIGISAGNDFFYGSVSPSAIYVFNRYYSAGLGLKASYASGDSYSASSYGGSVLNLLYPLPMLRFSAELEILQVNRSQEYIGSDPLEEDYIYPALFIGAGYTQGAVTIGIRYDVLYNEEKSIYGNPFTPFVSVYF